MRRSLPVDGTVLRFARLTAGLTLRDLELASGVSRPYVSSLERGAQTRISPEKLAALARALGVEEGTLVREESTISTATA